MAHNVGHISSGGFRSESLSTEAETTIELLPLVTPQTPPLLICRVVHRLYCFINLIPISIN
jgi:hypothetical protein